MADFEEVGAKNESWDQSKPVQGFYIQKEENVGPNNSMMYTLRTEDGDIGVWGSTVIDQKFARLQLGQEVRVEFTGMSTEKGKFGKSWKTYRVQAKPLEVGGAPTKPAADDLSDLFN